MSAPPSPTPEDPTAKEGTAKRAVKIVGGGLGCLAFLVGLVIALFGVLAIFLDDPIFWIAAVALVVAVGAYKVSKRGW